MFNYGFTINECDKSVYTKTIENAYIIVCHYVEYMLIIKINIEVSKSIKRMLSNNFDMKDLSVTDVM